MPEDTSLVPVMGDGYTSAYDSLHALKNAITTGAPDAQYWYVDYTNGSDSNDGKSWDKAFKTLTKAIDSATTNTGDQIIVRNDGFKAVTVPSTKESLHIVGIGTPTITGNMTVSGDSTRLTGLNITGDVSIDAKDVTLEMCSTKGDVTGSAENDELVRRIDTCQIYGALTIGESTIIDDTLVSNAGGVALTVRGDPDSYVLNAILRGNTVLVGETGIYIGDYVGKVYISSSVSIFADAMASGATGVLYWDNGTTFEYNNHITPTGGEDTLYSSAPLMNMLFKGGYIDLSDMKSGDTTTIKIYVKNRSGGSYKVVDRTTYTDAQDEPMAFINMQMPYKYGLKITIETTVTSDIYYEVF